jgi:kynurenine formamidase
MNRLIVALAAAAVGAAALFAQTGPSCPPFSVEPLRTAQILDLSHPLDAATPYWPGEGYFGFTVKGLATLEKDKVFSQSYATPEHLGTHVDAPNHFWKSGIAVDRIPPKDLIGPAVVFDLTFKASRSPDVLLGLAEVHDWERSHGVIPEGAIAILRSGWWKRAGDAAAYRNADAAGTMRFPSFSLDAVQYLVGARRVAAIGVDTLSVDPGSSRDFPVHVYLGQNNRYALENLTNLDRLPARGALVIVAPVKIAGGSGGQARVFAVVP